jgi:hypothetical protein
MKLLLCKLVFWLWFVTRGYYLWSKLWMLVLEGRYRRQNLTPYVSLGQLEEALSKMTWTSDPLHGTFDVISSPEKVEFILRQFLSGARSKADVGDCDDFALYAAVSIQNMIKRGRLNASDPEFVTVTWLDAGGKFHGHNICIFKDPEGYCHIGNWFRGRAQCGSGSDGVRFANPKEIADWFSTAENAGVLIGYARATPQLKLKELCLG